MIPREILKKIRQIELRTNRLVTGFLARGCVQATERVRTVEAFGSEVFLPSLYQFISTRLKPLPLEKP